MKNEKTKNPLMKDSLLNYILPFIKLSYSDKDKSNTTDKNIKKNLEEKLKAKEAKEYPEELFFLNKFFSDNVSKIKQKEKNLRKKPDKNLEFIFWEEHEKTQNINANSFNYEIISGKKSGNQDYKISITYTSDFSEENLNILISLDNYHLTNPAQNKNNLNTQNNYKSDINTYAFSITRKKDNLSEKGYEVKISYEKNYEEERLSISYKLFLKDYLKKRENAMQDFSDRVPGKFVNVFPESLMGGILGFTYLGDHSIGLRADLTGEKKRMVDIHESIHTPDEYETRVLTDWIMKKEKVKYFR